ncbi:MAG: LPS-assembly protein LptD [Verrucomicrobia bacterium]|nr:LPS-assembly protein LptD [Verrucomicrobiota bacterium]
MIQKRLSHLALALILGCSLNGLAQPDKPVAEAEPLPIDITADSLEYLSDQSTMIAVGNVVVKDLDATLTADYMQVNTKTYDVLARGNVLYQKGDRTWNGDEFSYNIKTRAGDFGAFETDLYDPFFITAEDSKRISEKEFKFQGIRLTTCKGDPPLIYVKAKEGEIANDRVTMRGATLKVGFLPIMYFPKYSKSLLGHERYFEILPGYSSRQGAFLLTGYHYPVADSVKGITHVDLRSKRGVGVGQDFEWENKSEEYHPWNGAIRGYYLQDNEPFTGPDSEFRTEDNVSEERYRVKLNHFQMFSDRDYVLGELNYLSDPFVLNDFFNDEYRQNVQPENRLTLTHRGDQFTAALLFNTRLNDFYENVNRLPELTLNVNRQPILDSDLYYESQNSGSFLERVYPEGSENDDYDAFRIDSGHTLYYPTRQFGFLNLTPRAGYRGTYYSRTFETVTFTNDLVVTDSNNVASVTNEVVSSINDLGADFRNVYQVGWEGSFKAFKTWDDVIVLGDGDGLRHVAEPYLNHTYQPRPNLEPYQLPQFDSVDTVDREHTILLGFRNKLQTRRNQEPVDLVNANLFTYYRVEKETFEEDFTDFFFDVELRLVPWLPIDFDGSYDTYESQFTQFSTQARLLMAEDSYLGLEYRFRNDEQSLVSAELDLYPYGPWSFAAAVRYNDEIGEVEEYSMLLKRNQGCLGYGLGFKQLPGFDGAEDDTQVWLQLWLTAFPGSSLELGN